MIKKNVIKYNLITLKEKKINKMSTLFYINTHVTHTRTIFNGFKNARKKQQTVLLVNLIIQTCLCK